MSLISRSQFLRGDWRGNKPDIRPPGALVESEFAAACDGCGNCVIACEQNIVVMSLRKLPLLDFSQAGCTFCADCAAVCEPGALQQIRETGKPHWQFRAVISDSCVAKHGTSCVRCIEECEFDAIVAKPALFGRTDMQVNNTDCNGCGMCISTCPVNAITLEK